ncbi:MAG: hypothetical protein GX589_00165 [Deltaproteobacteria bacterium]|nr:hypothetical protein [Deltaproteobacteria bacterium]
MKGLICTGLMLVLFFVGCSLPKKVPPSEVNYYQLAQKTMPPEQSRAIINEAVSNWYYGQGLGDTALKAGTVVVFPPYVLILLGNAALSLSGYETVGVSNFLPEQGASVWSGFYDSVTGAPGRVAAAAAGKEFRTPELAEEKLREKLSQGAGSLPPEDVYQ